MLVPLSELAQIVRGPGVFALRLLEELQQALAGSVLGQPVLAFRSMLCSTARATVGRSGPLAVLGLISLLAFCVPWGSALLAVLPDARLDVL